MTSIARSTAAVVGALVSGARSMVHPRMVLLTFAPFVVAAVLWAAIVAWGWEPAVNEVQRWLSGEGLERWLPWLVGMVGLQAWSVRFAEFTAPVLVALMIVPFVILTILVIVGGIAGPVAARHVARRRYASVAARGETSVLRSFVHALVTSAAFTVVWLATLPLWLVPGLAFVVPLVLWGWLNYRVMSFDALAAIATSDERRIVMQRRRVALWSLGIAIAFIGGLPTALWVGGAAAFVFAPMFALVSLWLYVCIFVYSALVFAHYCMGEVARVRASQDIA